MEDFVTQELIFMTVAGSRMYGTNTPDSDIDKRGVCVPPRNVVMGFARKFDQQQFEGEDTIVFSLMKFMKLCVENNPNILELLFAPEDCIEVCTPTWEKLLERREDFISAKCYHSFSGYAHQQLSRLKGHRAWLRDPPTHQPAREEFGLKQAGQGLQQVAKGVDVSEISPEALVVIAKEKRYKAAMRRWQDYQRWIKERNPVRAKLEAKFGFDTKHALHLVRILRMGHEILTTGKVIVRRPDAEELLAIRNGCYTYDELMEVVEPLRAKIDKINADKSYVVPFGPPKVELSDFAVELHDYHWKNHAKHGGGVTIDWAPKGGRVVVTEQNRGDVFVWLQRRIEAATTFDGERLKISNFFVNGVERSDIQDVKIGDTVESPVAWMGRMQARQLKHR